mmetsp:Transcript_51982/g.111218  ORF Transcript_51982/g.111218 Transcript_51982/m.111218 type:complete len:826 (+) Transcript_51982:152-2629(+)
MAPGRPRLLLLLLVELGVAPRTVRGLAGPGQLVEFGRASSPTLPIPLPLLRPPERAVDQNGRHSVEHIALLNKAPFWWLMGVVVLSVGVAIVQIEAGKDSEAKDGEAVRLLPGLHVPLPSNLDEHRKAEEEKEEEGEDVSQKSRSFYTLENLTKLAFCVVGLNMSMLIWGIGQEFVATNNYGTTASVDIFPSMLFVVFINRMVSVIFTGVLVRLHGKTVCFTGYYMAGAPAMTNLIASWCQYTSLTYVTFMLQTTIKSCKLLPVIILSSLRGKRHTFLDYSEMLVIVTALVVFGMETEGRQDDPVPVSTSKGLVLLMCLLLFDSLTPHLQDVMLKSVPDLDAIRATFAMASFASVVSFIILICSGQLFSSFGFLQQHPIAILHIAVLSLASTLTAYLITYTIKHFGPVIFTLIATTRQAISVCISAAFFNHYLSALAFCAAGIMFCTVMVRAVRPLMGGKGDQAPAGEEALPGSGAADAMLAGSGGAEPLGWLMPRTVHSYRRSQLLLCTVAIHVLFCFYGLSQEFFSSHTFNGHLFNFPLFLVAMNRTLGAIMALCMCKFQGLPVVGRDMRFTVLPATPNLVATVMQYEALYLVYFPVQNLMKSLKVLPVMFVGRLMKNRFYNALDYAEGMIITALVGFFVWDFQYHKGKITGPSVSDPHSYILLGVLLMVGYVFLDSLTSNLEDFVYQHIHIDPAQQMLGMEIFSGIVAWIILLATGELNEVRRFLYENPEAWQYLALLAAASSFGTYACTVTVRLFGPAVFTLLMTSRQILSLMISLLIFQHKADWLACLCLGSVCLLILTASMRRAGSYGKDLAKADCNAA